MNSKIRTMIATVIFFYGLGVAAEMPSVQQLAEIRLQRSSAEMHAKAMPVMMKIKEFKLSATKQEKVDLDKRISTSLLDAPPTFGVGDNSLSLRTQFVKTVPELDALQPDELLWDSLARHLHVAAYIPKNAFDKKMAEAKVKDEQLIAEGKITRPPCHFGYPRTPNMAKVQREKWAADNWNIDILPYRLALLEKYTPVLRRYLNQLDEDARIRFSRLFSTRAGLTQEEAARFFGKQGE